MNPESGSEDHAAAIGLRLCPWSRCQDPVTGPPRLVDQGAGEDREAEVDRLGLVVDELVDAVEDDNDRAVLYVLETARGRGNRLLTPLGAARALGDQGTDASDSGPGIETLTVLLGSNNALQAVTKLKLAWSGAGYDDIAKKGAFTVWRPEHFAAEWALAGGGVRG